MESKPVAMVSSALSKIAGSSSTVCSLSLSASEGMVAGTCSSSFQSGKYVFSFVDVRADRPAKSTCIAGCDVIGNMVRVNTWCV